MAAGDDYLQRALHNYAEVRAGEPYAWIMGDADWDRARAGVSKVFVEISFAPTRLYGLPVFLGQFGVGTMLASAEFATALYRAGLVKEVP